MSGGEKKHHQKSKQTECPFKFVLISGEIKKISSTLRVLVYISVKMNNRCHSIPCLLITDLFLLVLTKQTLENNKYFVPIVVEELI